MKIIYVFYTDILTCACVYIYTHINTYLYIHLYVIWGEKKMTLRYIQYIWPLYNERVMGIVPAQWKICIKQLVDPLHMWILNQGSKIQLSVVPSTMCVWTAWVHLYDIVPHTQYSTQSISTGAYIPNTRDWNQETPDFVNLYCVVLCGTSSVSIKELAKHLTFLLIFSFIPLYSMFFLFRIQFSKIIIMRKNICSNTHNNSVYYY